MPQMEPSSYTLLDGLPLAVITLKDGHPEEYNRAARALFPDAGEHGLPRPLAGLLKAADPDRALTGALQLDGRDYQVTLAPPVGGRRLLCLIPQQAHAGLSPDAVATQLRQCLADLHLSAHKLAQLLQPMHDPAVDRLYHVLHQGLYRLLRMSRHLEAADQLESDQVPMGALDLVDLCVELEREVETLARGMGVVLTYESPLLTLPTVGNGPLLQMLLLNLLSNALKAVDGGGEILLRLTREDGRALLTVENDGRRPADLSALFRGGEAQPMPGSGLGLGLMLVSRIAALHQGAVLAMDTETGTRVVVSLPIRAVDRDLPLRTPRLESDSGFSTVLVELSDALPGEYFDYFDQP